MIFLSVFVYLKASLPMIWIAARQQKQLGFNWIDNVSLSNPNRQNYQLICQLITLAHCKSFRERFATFSSHVLVTNSE